MSGIAPEDLHVLIIDDDPIIRRIIAKALLKHHYQVVTAESAEGGLEQLPFFTFHVAFVDHRLPGMEGLVFGEYLRKNNPHMEIALVTGDSDEQLDKLCETHSITLIRKPFDLTQILDVVTRYRNETAERTNAESDAGSDDFHPPIATFLEEITEAYSMPGIPSRVEERLVSTIKESLNNLRSSKRYSEQDRVVALAGLMAAKVLNIDLPKTAAGNSLFEEYDAAMNTHGKHPGFGHPVE